MSENSARYHMKGRTHPRRNTSIAHNLELQQAIHGILLENDERPLQAVRELLVARHQIRVGRHTARRARNALKWTWGNLRPTPMIRDVNKVKRVAHAKAWIEASQSLEDAMFTDETSVSLEHYSRRCYRLAGRVVQKPVAKHPAKLHVWGGITADGPGPIKIFGGIMDGEYFRGAIIDGCLLPWLQTMFPGNTETIGVFMDNDPKHSASAKYMQERGIKWVRTPPESPDLNPIEMVWAHLKHWLRSIKKPRNLDCLAAAINEYWQRVLTPTMCRRYVNHIKKVLPKVVEFGGGATGL